mmetsp:Transcript_154956/g.273726  ORF Transcript_154956/g.273726 Transcript_154956/m.273726 type:complete len:139 (-) Transcript_154956:139-555(-)
MGWLPDHVWLAQKANRSGGNKGGSSWSKPSWGKGKAGGWNSGGGGKGGGKHRPKSGFKVIEQNAASTVWLGGIPEGTSYEELQTTFSAAGTCKKVLVTKKGTGFAWFASPQEASTCIAMFNGAQVGNSFLQVDTYSKK